MKIRVAQSKTERLLDYPLDGDKQKEFDFLIFYKFIQIVGASEVEFAESNTVKLRVLTRLV